MSIVLCYITMTERTYKQIFEDIEDDISMGWIEMPLTNKDKKRITSTISDELAKFSVELEYNDRHIVLTCYEKHYIPEFDNVFGILVGDARCAHKHTFPDFCNEYGYDTDSIRALNIYKYCKKQKKKLFYLLGEELFLSFMECEFDW